MNTASVHVGIDIGGTKCGVSLGNRKGEGMDIVARTTFPTLPGQPDAVIQVFLASIDRLLAEMHMERADLAGIGISCGGPLDSRRGLILSPPNLPGWDAVPIVDIFQDQLGVRSFLQNDANACAFAEWKFGAGRGTRHMAFLTFGTGLGAGLILSGRLYTGASDMAGEIGHIRQTEDGPVGYGKAGSMEGYCSGNGIRQIALRMLENPTPAVRASALYPLSANPEQVTAKAIADLADAGDDVCREIFRTSGDMLGRGLSILIDILNPEIIVIGSIFRRCHHLLWESTRNAIEREAIHRSRDACRVVPSQLGDQVGDYAALSVALGEC